MMNKKKKMLADVNPTLAIEADGWDPNLFSSGSNKKMPWKCKNGHRWDAVIGSRALGHGCPYCAGQKVLPGINDLATEYPLIAAEANGWDPKDYMSGSHKRMNWKCANGHEFKNSIGNRTRSNQECPFCVGRSVAKGLNDLATTHPVIASEACGWDPTIYSAGSEAKLQWKCPSGHTWVTAIYSRTAKKNTNCPVCSGRKVIAGINDLVTTHPELADQAYGWDPSKVSYGSGKKLPWKCPKGHVWNSKPNSRSSQNSDCLVCSNREVLVGFNDLATSHPVIASEAFDWDPKTVTRGSNAKRAWICQDGHKWSAIVANRTNLGHGCPSCAKTGFNPSKDGYLYFLKHPLWQMLQIGISNFPDQRLSQHKKLGWEIVEVRGPMDGLITAAYEKDILKMLRKAGADLANDKIVGKFDGYSEAWSTSTYPVSGLTELLREIDN